MSTISHKLKLLRKREKLSQKALADLTGVSQGAIGDIESGRKKNFSGESLFKICNHPRLRSYALWLVTNPNEQVNEPQPPYTTDLETLLKDLDSTQLEQVATFIQLTREQTTPD